MDVSSQLARAAFAGDFNTVQILIGPTLDLNLALRSAAAGNQLGIIDYLISMGADDLNGALIEAAAFGNFSAVSNLISRGATYLDGALIAAQGNRSMMIYLISQGAENRQY